MAVILIVEDEAHIARVLSIWLSRHGHEVIEAPEGAAALKLLDLRPVDLVVSDMNMPGVDGMELARILREERRLTIPFLMLTARCDQARLANLAKPYGIVLYPKPFVPSRFVSDIERHLGQCETKGAVSP